MKPFLVAVIWISCIANIAIAAPTFPVFTAQYQVDDIAEFSLSSQKGEQDKLLLELNFVLQGIWAHLGGGAHQMTVQAMWENGKIIPKRVDYINEKEKTVYVFNQDNFSVEVEYKDEQYDLPLVSPYIFEMVSMHLQISVDMENTPAMLFYDAVVKGKQRRYVFFNQGLETVETALGKIKAVRLDGFRKGKLRYQYWLSPSHQYLIVKAKLIRDGKVRQTIQMKSVNLQ